jgi:hypothetical protein
MKQPYSNLSSAERESIHGHFARQIVARLDEDSNRLPSDVGERLRFAREQALLRAEQARLQTSSVSRLSMAGAGALLAGAGSAWWMKLASLAPLAVLAAGLILIQRWETRTQISAAAEVDAALLADDLPPKAYHDPGFFEFLKSPHE